ncbi:uncharacterized protein LOC117166973 [Belonocnema kinseyi]|uniref:uncharacterized protein LOC117166973 n=1 Tax=Belonocnema kinseyi TaxID=2817044 RepID=UPI00143CD49B|nr:uncharacterized protein LOC117166973 [Belonocnema kinseyi]
MRKVTYVILSLTALDLCALFNFAESTELAGSKNVNDRQHRNHQPAVFDSLEVEYSEDEEYTNQESNHPGESIGRWRSNGKALEPKWRDGDSVPLVPFQSATVKNKSSNVKNQSSIEVDEDKDEKTFINNRHSTHWMSQSEEKEIIITDKYDFNKRHKPDNKNDYQGFRSPELRLSRRRKPPQLEDEVIYHPSEKSSSSSEDFQEENNARNKKESKIPTLSYDNNEYLERVALRYRETFQNHPNEYELNDEEYQRPRPRKRRPPQNYEFSEVKTSPLSSTDKITSSPTYSTIKSQRRQEATRRNNLTRTNHNRTTIKTDSEKPSENSELKSLLKMQQVEGVSLSETLQRRNLTLSDLLQGKADIINLLKSTHEDNESEEELNARVKAVEVLKISASSTSGTSSTTQRTPWLPAKILGNPVDPFSNFRAASTQAYQKVLPTQEERKDRIRPTESMNAVKMPISSENPIVVTTTESVNIQDKERVKITYDEDEIMEFSDFTMKNSKTSTIPNNSEKKETTQPSISEADKFNRDSESTLSIEHILSSTKQPSLTENESAIDTFWEQSRERIRFENKIPHSGQEDDHISSTEMSSFDFEYQNDGPHDTSHKIAYQKNEETHEEEPNSKELTPKNSQTSDFPQNHKTYLNHKNDQIYLEMEPDARAEILELFDSGSSANKLESLLRARNMSLDDLIALRQRGSSQLHLAEVAQIRDNSFRSSAPKDEQNQDFQEKKEDAKIVKSDCTLPPVVKELVEWIKQKEPTKETPKEILHIKEFETLPPNWFDQFGYPQIEQRSKEQELEEFNAEKFRERGTDVNPESSNQPDNLIDALNFDSSEHFKNRQNPEEILFYTSEVPPSNLPERRNNSMISIENVRVQEIESDISGTFNNIYRLNADEGKSEERNSISRVRPSIIASGAILGATIVGFLGIFIACRIRQKQKYTYRNTFSRAVFQSPILTTRKLSNSSSLNTIMVNVVATSTTKRPEKTGSPETDDDYDHKSDIENDSLDANDSWETIPDFMK